jgi:hypothetical protein
VAQLPKELLYSAPLLGTRLEAAGVTSRMRLLRSSNCWRMVAECCPTVRSLALVPGLLDCRRPRGDIFCRWAIRKVWVAESRKWRARWAILPRKVISKKEL